jgi:predicted metal-binding protein
MKPKIDISKFVKILKKNISKDHIKFSKNVRNCCKIPYKNNENGCPNYNKNPLCPPVSQYMPNVLDNYDKFVLVYAKFDLKNYIIERRKINPKLSYKQARNSRHWQKSIKKLLNNTISNIKADFVFGCGSGFSCKTYNSNNECIMCQSMESAGINVMLLFKKERIDFEIKPRNKVVLACLLMYEIENSIKRFFDRDYLEIECELEKELLI